MVNRDYKRSGHDFEKYLVDVKVDRLNFYITYSLKKPARYGGGAKFTVSKDDCKIVKKELYQ